MKYTKIIGLVSALLSSTLVVFFRELFIKYIECSLISILIAILCSAVCSFIFESIFNDIPKRALCIRKHINPFAKYEGVWIQKHNSTDEKAICRIEYLPESDQHIFAGQHFTKDNFIVKFTSKNIHYDELLDGFDYLVEGQHENGEFIKCWGYISFEHDFRSHKYISGKGSFIEIGSSLSRIDFTMTKVEKKYIKELSTKNTHVIDELIRN